MKKKLLYGVLLITWILTCWWFCEKYICVEDASGKLSQSEDCSASISIHDGNSFSITSKEPLRFLHSEFNYFSISAISENALKKTARYLKQDSMRSLLIIGRFQEDEKYIGLLPDLGYARARMIMSMMIGFGAPADQVEIQSIKAEELCFQQDTLKNVISFSFTDAKDKTKILEQIKQRLLNKPIIFDSLSASKNLEINALHRKTFADFALYMDHIPNTGLSIQSFINENEPAESRVQLANNRALKIRELIINSTGINSNRLTVKSPDTNASILEANRVEVILLQE